MARTYLRLGWIGLILGGLMIAPAASADPVLRHQADQRGDVVVFGSTLTHDCGSTVAAPAGATASCAGQTNIDDTAGDLYWLDNTANASVLATQARTSATLELPPGSTVTYARLYWAALKDGQNPDTSVVLDWLYGNKTTVTADHCQPSILYPYPETHPTWYYYQCSGDATSYVQTWGAGDFRVSDVEAIELPNVLVHVGFSAWTLVVFYENPSEDLRNLALFDGFEFVDPNPANGYSDSIEASLSGFLVPQGFDAKMAAFMYEGDHSVSGDHFTMNGQRVSNASNPEDNVFNSSRTVFGQPYVGPEDVPAFTGEPASMSSYDLDTVDVTSFVQPGDTSAVVGAGSIEDKFILGGFVTSITNKSPDFGVMTKTVEDVNGGAVLQGDVLRYTITAKNSGNDAAVNAVLTDELEQGLTFVPGSIEIVAGGVNGMKTDASGDDQAEYTAAQRRVTVRVGTGATANAGGTVPVGTTVTVRFSARVAISSGSIANTAILKASGQAGGGERTYESDGDPNAVGKQPTVIIVNECDTDADCPTDRPHCDPVTHVCMGCTSDADCTNPALPACQPNGSCGECSSTNDALCVNEKPVCSVPVGQCVFCIPGPNAVPQCEISQDGPLCIAGSGSDVFCGCMTDSDCGGPQSARVCDATVSRCIDGCRGENGNGCPSELDCSSKDTSIGQCFAVEADAAVPLPDADVPDAGAVEEAPSLGADASEDEGGCACSVPSTGGWRFSGIAFAAMAGAMALARRRRTIR